MRKFIEITQSNFESYSDIDIAAFSIAVPGAMGEGGGVIIVDTNGVLYHTNYCHEYLDKTELETILPVMKGVKLGIFDYDWVPEQWTALYMGFGNHLIFKQIYSEKFMKSLKDNGIDDHGIHMGNLYQKWLELMLEIVNGDTLQ